VSRGILARAAARGNSCNTCFTCTISRAEGRSSGHDDQHLLMSSAIGMPRSSRIWVAARRSKASEMHSHMLICNTHI
jgi:hypothetical protein